MSHMNPRLRRAGSPWRLLVHGPGPAGVSHHVTNRPSYGSVLPDNEHRETHVLEATEFDELAVGRWLHVEQMDAGRWWARIGDVTVQIEVDRDGRPRAIAITGPDTAHASTPECDYRLDWDRSGKLPVDDVQAKR